MIVGAIFSDIILGEVYIRYLPMAFYSIQCDLFRVLELGRPPVPLKRVGRMLAYFMSTIEADMFRV